DGRVLLVGGSLDSIFLNESELFDPTTNSFSAGDNMQHVRKSHTANLLSDGVSVLIAGGKSDDGDLNESEIYDIPTGIFSRVAQLNTGRSLSTSTLLPDGKVLLAAGRHGGTPTPTAELFDPFA